jgi:hypothetical protein
MESAVFILYLIAIIVVGFLVYLVLKKPDTIKVVNTIPRPSFETHHWGYASRPWWRRFNGLPGVGAPPKEPKMPVPPKPLIV